MKIKRTLSILLSVILLFSMAIPALAAANEPDQSLNSLNEIFLQTYSDALNSSVTQVIYDEDAYAYLLHHMDIITRNEDSLIIIDTQAIELDESSTAAVVSFVDKLNTLISLQAITINENLVLSFVDNPQCIQPRRPTATIMTEARNHAAELRSVYNNAVFAVNYVVAGNYFAQRVRSGGIWDYKSYMGASTLYYMEDLRENMDGETIGNFHYGYVGSAVFSADILKSAAGFYQLVSGTSDLSYYESYFDDPADQADIQYGIDVYNSEH